MFRKKNHHELKIVTFANEKSIKVMWILKYKYTDRKNMVFVNSKLKMKNCGQGDMQTRTRIDKTLLNVGDGLLHLVSEIFVIILVVRLDIFLLF